jgi:hypothetical protein
MAKEIEVTREDLEDRREVLCANRIENHLDFFFSFILTLSILPQLSILNPFLISRSTRKNSTFNSSHQQTHKRQCLSEEEEVHPEVEEEVTLDTVVEVVGEGEEVVLVLLKVLQKPYRKWEASSTQ